MAYYQTVKTRDSPRVLSSDLKSDISFPNPGVEAVTCAATLINDEYPASDELAKSICDLINNGEMVESGVIPESPRRYKATGLTEIPMKYSLLQNYPNPLNPVTEICFSLPTDANVKLEIFNLEGQRTATLVDGHLRVGIHKIKWDGNNVASGVYFCGIKATDFVQSKKMLLLK